MDGKLDLSSIDSQIAPGIQKEVINAIGQDGLVGDEVIMDMVIGINNILAENGLSPSDVVVDIELGKAKGKTLQEVFSTLGDDLEVKGE